MTLTEQAPTVHTLMTHIPFDSDSTYPDSAYPDGAYPHGTHTSMVRIPPRHTYFAVRIPPQRKYPHGANTPMPAYPTVHTNFYSDSTYPDSA